MNEQRQLMFIKENCFAIDRFNGYFVLILAINEHESHKEVLCQPYLDLATEGWEDVDDEEYICKDYNLEPIPILPEDHGTYGIDLRVRCMGCKQVYQKGYGIEDITHWIVCSTCAGVNEPNPGLNRPEKEIF